MPLNRLGKRVALAAAALGMTGALASGASFALFSSSAAQATNSFAAGTVTLTRTAQTLCDIQNAAPGDSGTCTYTLAYSGSLSAYVSLDVTVTGTAGDPSAPGGATGSEALYDGTQHGLSISITDAPSTGRADLALWTGSAKCFPSYLLNGRIDNPCPVATSKETGQPLGSGPVSSGWTDTVTVNWSLPLDAPNVYQGGHATVTLVASAVQHRNNAYAFEGFLPGTKGVSTPTTLNGPGNVVNGQQVSTDGVFAYILPDGQFAQFDAGTWSFDGTIGTTAYTWSGPYRWWSTGTYGGTGCTISPTTGPSSQCVVENQEIEETLVNTAAGGGVDKQWARMTMVNGQPSWDVTVQATGPMAPLAGSTDAEPDGDSGF